MSEAEAWVRFVAAALAGMNAVCDAGGDSTWNNPQCVEHACLQADAMLDEYRERFGPEQAAGN